MTMRRMVIAAIALSTSCSVVLQDSVRSSSVYCSTSNFWWVSDVALASAWGFVVSRASNPANPPVAYVPTAVFGASALLGIYKRHNCVRWRETAPPEVWAAMAEAQRRQAEANAAAAQEAANQPEPEAAQDAAPAITCDGGAVVVGDTCACPDGTSWNGAQCAAVVVVPGRPTPSPRPPPTPIIHVTRPQAPPVVQRSPIYHAMFKANATAALSCQAFDQQDSMAACSRHCMGYLMQKLTCRCDPGACR